jgi:NRAMP (natural resistance-associated macrophage protein)-like metal ion transporter
LVKVLGPGLIAGASDDDPATIGTCAQIGAALGFATLWTMPLTLPLMAAVQFISAKIGLVGGLGLAGVIRKHYPCWLLYGVVSALVVGNTINAASDLGGIAAALNLLVPISAAALAAPAAILILILQIWGSYRLIVTIFKWLALVLLAYVGAGILARPDWGTVLYHTFVPTFRFDRQFIEALVAITGTTFSPYLYFWQSSQEVEEKVALGRNKLRQRQGATDAELRYAGWDINIGMVASNLVTYFIILASGATLFRAGRTNIQTAAEAAEALRPLAGPAAETLLAIGLIGTGVLTVPVLTGSAAYALSEAFGWARGLQRTPGRAPQFYAIIAIATAMAVLINYLSISPIAALYWTSVIYGFLSPPLLLVLMIVSNNETVIGRHTNGTVVNALGWIATAATFAAAGALVVIWLFR